MARFCNLELEKTVIENTLPFIHVRDNLSHHFDVNDALFIDVEKKHLLKKFNKFRMYTAKSTS